MDLKELLNHVVYHGAFLMAWVVVWGVGVVLALGLSLMIPWGPQTPRDRED